jgi:hypothetical protein
MNLLQDVEGTLPRDKDFLLEVIDRYLSLNPEERLHYRLGRRMGLYHGVADMARPELSQRVEKALAQIQEQHPDDVESVLTELANTMI